MIALESIRRYRIVIVKGPRFCLYAAPSVAGVYRQLHGDLPVPWRND